MKWPADRMKSQADKGFGMWDIAEKMEKNGVDDIIHLEFGRPSFDTPIHIKSAAKAALDAGIVHYGHFRGSEGLRLALTKKLRDHNGIHVNPDEVLVTNGLTQGAFATFMASLDQGDEVIILEPYYPQHNKKIELVGGKVVLASFVKSQGFRLDPKAIEEKITPRTRMIVFINPANPIGRVFSREEVSALAEIAIKYDLLVMTDEVYEYVIYDDHKHVSIASLPGMRERTISIFAFTKAYAMDGWRLGYVAAKKEFIDELLKVTQNETTSVNVFAQEGARAAVVSSQECVQAMVAEDRRRRDFVCERLNAMPNVKCPTPEGTIYVFPDFSAWNKRSAELANELMTKVHVATDGGEFYGPSGAGHLRICFGSEPYERLEEAMNRIENYLKSMA